MLRLICALCCVSLLSAQEKPKLDLHGDRFPGLKYEELTPPQKVIADRALASRGTIGIFNIELRSPELTEATRGIISSRIAPVISAATGMRSTSFPCIIASGRVPASAKRR
jgi:hypothetical protein